MTTGLNSYEKTHKLTVRFSLQLKNEMQKAIVNAGYGLHGKSRWLTECLEEFISLTNYVDYVEQGIQINQAELNQVEAFYIPSSSYKKLKNTLMLIRQKYPMLEGVQSALIRSAVVYKLMLS